MLFLEPSATQLHCFIFKMWLEMTVIRGRGHSLCSVEGDEYIHLTCMEYNLRCKGLCWVLLEKIKLLTTKTAKNYLPWNFIKDFIYLFLDRREAREKERERNIHVWLTLMRPLLGTWLETQACALTGNRTSNPLVYRPALNPLSHTSWGPSLKFLT